MYAVSDKFHDAVMAGKPTQLRLSFFEGTIEVENISSNGLSYSSMAFDEDDLTIGSACSAELGVNLINHDGKLSSYDFDGTEFTAEIGVLIDGEYEWVPLGVFISEKPDKLKTTIISLSAHDRMVMFDKDADSFLLSLSYPITLKGVFIALCGYVGVPYVDSDFPNADKVFDTALIDAQGVTCREVLQWIAEAASSFARINRAGACELAWFEGTNVTFTKTPQRADYFNVAIAEYSVAQIDKLQVAGSETDIGVIVGTGTNGYHIVDNPFLYGYADAQIRPYAEVIYDRLSAFPVYVPVEMDAVGDWAVDVGDIITVQTDGGNISMPVFRLDLTWNGSPRIQYVNSGAPSRPVMSAENRRKIQAGKAMYEIERTVEGLKQTVSKTQFLTPVLSDTDPSTEWEDPQNFEGYQWFDGTDTRIWDGEKWLLVINPDFRQTATPTATKTGQYWYNPSTGVIKRWSGSSWVSDSTVTIPQTWASSMQTEMQVTADGLRIEVSNIQSDITELDSDIGDVSTEVSNTKSSVTMLTATVNGISSQVSNKVGKTEVISTINQSAEQVKINAGKITLEGVVTANSYFKINADGSMTTTNATITGKVTATSGKIGGFTIDGNNLEGSYISFYPTVTGGKMELGYVTLTGSGGGLHLNSTIYVQDADIVIGYVSQSSEPSIVPYGSGIGNVGVGDQYWDQVKANSHPTASSIRYKKKILDISDEDVGSIDDIRPVTYELKSKDDGKRFPGFIAEELATIAPMFVSYDDEGLPESIDYSRIVVLLVHEVKKMRKRLAALEG